MSQTFDVIFGAVCTMLFIGISIAQGLMYFRTFNRIVADTGNRSITPLFNSGYHIDISKGRVLLNTTGLKGAIDGYPTTVSLSDMKLYVPRKIYFSFATDGESDDKNNRISFPLDSSGKLEKDVKPDVLACIAELKAKGIAPSKDVMY